jgi:anti-sigma regulatory factor (Ser/Thr protein kinase)
MEFQAVPRRLKRHLLAAERDEPDGMNENLSATLTLPGVERSVAYSRRFCRDMLGLDHPALDDVTTCVSEAVTNAVVHTRSGDGGKMTLAFFLAAALVVVEVTDEGADGALPRLRDDPLAVSGRGLQIIDSLTCAWSVRQTVGHTTMRMEFTL